MKILTEITRENVIQAAKDYDKGHRPPRFKDSHTYDVIVNGKRYPPKIIISLASKRSLGRSLEPDEFRGGWNTPCFRILEKLGFPIVLKNDKLIYPDEVEESSFHTEGTVRQIIVNSYERNIEARDKCIEHYGLKCQDCCFDFEEYYGELGAGFIHVHHKIPLSEIGKEYEVDPINDLIPVCPNCHAMLHKKKPAISIDELRDILKKNGKVHCEK